MQLSSQRLIGPLISIVAGISIVFALTGYLVKSTKAGYWLVYVADVCFILASLVLITNSGGLTSPYLAMLFLLIVLSGLFGWIGLVTSGLIAHGLLAWQLIVQPGLSAASIGVFLLGVELSLLVSFFLWHKSHQVDKTNTSYTKLVHELGQVAGKSEIVINAIADGVIALDSQGIIQLINPAAQTMLGWGKQDAAKLDYRSVIKIVDSHGEPLNDQNNPINQGLVTGRLITTSTFSIRTMSDKTFLASIQVSPFGQIGTDSGGVIVVFRDVTRQKAEEREQAEFISTASHEMRTPVASIEGYLGLALNPQTAQIDDKARSYLEKAHENAQHLGRLFQDLLDVSKVEDGRMKNNPTIIDAVSFAKKIYDNFAESARAKGLEFKFMSQSAGSVTPLYYVKADADKLEEVLGNLIENAIKYTKQGWVAVDVIGDNELVKFQVADSGIGIPAEDIPHLFQKFYRVDSSDTREIGGTGLGLYLSRRLVESMDGHLRLDSQYGKGSTFTIELRRAQGNDMPEIGGL